MLGVAIAGYVNVFEPEYVVIGGGLSRASDLYLERAVDEAGSRALPALWKRVTVSLARGGADAGVIGAGVLAAQEVARDTAPPASRIDRGSRMTTAIAGTDLDQLSINTIRTLSMDAVQKANSGHPGAPMALAPIAYLLYTRVMKHNPAESALVRPRPLRALRRARLDAPLLDPSPERLRRVAWRTSRTSASSAAPRAGHPEYEADGAPGVEVTTGPLGQGVGNAVGFALAERMLAARFNRTARDRRPLHLRDRERRRHAGGRGLRGQLAGRAPRPRPAHRLLRRQQDPARRRDEDGLQRGRGQALRGLRLARAEPRRGHRAGPRRGGDRGGARGGPTGRR